MTSLWLLDTTWYYYIWMTELVLSSQPERLAKRQILQFTWSTRRWNRNKRKGKNGKRKRDDAWNVRWKQQWRLPCSEGMKAIRVNLSHFIWGRAAILNLRCVDILCKLLKMPVWQIVTWHMRHMSDTCLTYREQWNQPFFASRQQETDTSEVNLCKFCPPLSLDESLEGLATWAPWKLSRQVCWFTLCHRPNDLLQSIWHCSQLGRVYTLEAFAQLPNADPWKNDVGLKHQVSCWLRLA